METKSCQNCKKDFTIEPVDFEFYEKMRVPAPTWCPECRMVRRLGFWGYRMLYKRKCDMTGQEVISVYHPDVPGKVYKPDVWYSDAWDPKSYGKDYDFSRPFLEQFNELYKAVPKPALHTAYSTMIRSEYCNAAADLKDCYLAFKADRAENSAYLNAISWLKDCFDVAYANQDELCYESINIDNCYKTFYSMDCDKCSEVLFSENLVGCSNCIGCINLKNKQYHIFNEPYSKEEYFTKLESFKLNTRKGVENFKKQFEEFSKTQPRREFHGRRTENVSGDYIFNAKNVHDSYWVNGGENIRYSQVLQVETSKECYDLSGFGFVAEWVYDSAWIGINTNTVKFSFWNYGAHHIEYSIGCHSSGNMFGSIGIRSGEYCILNKQYTKEEYLELVPKIKKHMEEMPYVDEKGRVYKYGEFFPLEFSPWKYNESHAMDFLSKSREEVEAMGFSWREADTREYRPATIPLPDNIQDTDDSVLKEIFACEDCKKNYQIIPMELAFYRNQGIPPPAKCPLCRDRARIKRMNPIASYANHCAHCNKEIKTSYAPERKLKIYCEGCYNKEIV